MRRRKFLELAAKAAALSGATTFAGCGTIFHPERVHQPHSRDLDWGVVALDALGLILFFIPGVIAFAVDFATGAIYLPHEYPVVVPPPAQPMHIPPTQPLPGPQVSAQKPVDQASLKQIHINRDKLSPAAIETAVSKRIGQAISLRDDAARMSELAQLSDFEQQAKRHESEKGFGSAARAFFAKIEIS